MDLQTLFYVVSIIFMVSIVTAILILGIAAWKIKQQAQKIPAIAKAAVAGIAIMKRQQLMGTIGITAATAIATKLKDSFFSSDKKKSRN